MTGLWTDNELDTFDPVVSAWDGTLHVCSFANGIDDLTQRQQRDQRMVLRALDQTKRFSVFSATANASIAKTMDRLIERGYLRTQPEGYPWARCELTDKGRAVLETESAV